MRKPPGFPGGLSQLVSINHERMTYVPGHMACTCRGSLPIPGRFVGGP